MPERGRSEEFETQCRIFIELVANTLNWALVL
jgi:hypothetical protein